ncbi:MAG: hypothetical protein R3B70_47605 [Polyangiaceae bacterium]
MRPGERLLLVLVGGTFAAAVDADALALSEADADSLAESVAESLAESEADADAVLVSLPVACAESVDVCRSLWRGAVVAGSLVVAGALAAGSALAAPPEPERSASRG